jgi:endonuclease/exonuclease/phosphatase family metal-dependent hydrolase
MDVALFSETRIKPYDRFHIQNYHFYRIDRNPERKAGTAVAVRKGILHMSVDLPSLISVETTGVCIPIGNQEILIAVYKSPWLTWNDADIIELLSFRHKCILAGDLNAKHPSWNSAIANPSGQNLLQLFDTSDFEISAPQCPNHYSPVGNGNVLDIVVHKNIRLPDIIVSEILDSDHLPIMFHILDHVKTKQISEPLEKFTNWERVQSLASNVISPRVEVNSG